MGTVVCLILSTAPMVLSTDPACGFYAEDDVTGQLAPNRKWTGDFDEMAERRLIRVLVT